MTLRSAIEDMAFVKFIVTEQDRNQYMLSLAESMILRFVAENRQIKLAEAKKLAQISIDDTRKSCSNLVHLGLLESVMSPRYVPCQD